MSEATTLLRVGGCDLGKATACFAVGRLAADGSLIVEQARVVEHDGRPFEAFATWYGQVGAASFTALGATGLHGRELVAPVLAGLPEDACVEAAVPASGPLNVVRVGARGYSVWTRDAAGSVSFVENERCSSGTGETMVKIAGRFGRTIDEADRLASGAEQSIAITARCSVFAKSEMTHFANQGKPADQLFRGYFTSVARHAASLLVRARVPGPVWLVGGCSRIETFVASFRDQVGADVVVPHEAQVLEALGALHLAAERVGQLDAAGVPLPANPAALVRPGERGFTALPLSSDQAGRVVRMEADPVPTGAESAPTLLGLDLGSTGSKAVLTSLQTGQPVLDLYDRTRGNPVDAVQRLVRSLLERCAPDVRAVGLTGSGREAAATVLRAAWPEFSDRIVVVNEIVAHATAAIRCDPDDGRSLSIVEIGGQDAKFVQVRGGRITESDMNKACSAGTGSFLEEQATFYGVDRIEDFSGIAGEAARPPDLGQMCTVFVADAAGEALGEGFSTGDIFAGFEYSVIHNYINRVRGQRAFGDRIFFQGKPATSPTLARTLASVADREVFVPPNPGAMGAWGIGLCARGELRDRPGGPLPLAAVLDATVVARDELRCRDPQCATYCIIDRTTVQVGDVRSKVVSGGACPKFEVSTASRVKLPKEAPSAFAERAALLAGLDSDGPVVIGLPNVGALQGVLPWLAAFVKELGLGVRILASDKTSLSRGETSCYASDSCSPCKLAHGVVGGDVDVVVFPKILDLPEREGDAGKTCPVEQGMPDMIQHSLTGRGLSTRVVRPPLSPARGLVDVVLLRQLFRLAKELGAPAARVPTAAVRAAAAQWEAERELFRIGRRTLDFAREHGVPVVVMCGSLHVIHDPTLNAGIPGILRDNGVLALPMDCFSLPRDTPRMRRMVWADSRTALRVAAAARQRGDVFPLLLSSFGCGPAAYTEPLFAAVMEGYPHTALETDGHGGRAGFVTRIQAFLHSVRSYDDGPSPAPPERLELLELQPAAPLAAERGSRLVMYSMSDGITPLLAAFYRSVGYDAVAAGPNTDATLAKGRRDCSGKECLPYQLVWGAFREHLERREPDERTVLMQVTAAGECKNCMFTVKDQLSLQRMGLADDVSVRYAKPEPELGTLYLTKLFAGVVAWDILVQLMAWHRPSDPTATDALYRRHRDALVAHMERPEVPGLAGLLSRTAWWRELTGMLDRIAVDFAGVASGSARDARTVLLTGDVYLRADEFGSDDLVRKLGKRGLRVLVEPSHAFMEYLARPRRPGTGPGMRFKLAQARLVGATIRKRLYDRVRPLHPQIPDSDVGSSVAAASGLIDRFPSGESPMTVGSALHYWGDRACDGVVVVGPWGCGPTHISESLLRHQREIPTLFVYNDGTPIDGRRLDAFAFRLGRQERRTPKLDRPGEGVGGWAG